MDIEALLRKAEQDGCMVALNDIAPIENAASWYFVCRKAYTTPLLPRST